MNELKPMDHAEEVATHRHAVIGPLCALELPRGALAETIRGLSQLRFRAPGADLTRCYSVPTLERWYYAYRAHGLHGLKPQGRCDRGRGRKLTPTLRALICDIRREHPSASAALIVRTLEADGRLECGRVKPSTVQKLLRQAGLDRIAARDGAGATTRLRWQAAQPDALWHADVCHGPTLTLGRSPIHVYAPSTRTPNYVSDTQLRDALLVRERRRVRRDTTVSIGGDIYELSQGFLAGRVVDIVYSLLDTPIAPEVEYEGSRYPLHDVDPVKNSRLKRPPKDPAHDPAKAPVDFDPSRTLDPVEHDNEENIDAIF